MKKTMIAALTILMVLAFCAPAMAAALNNQTGNVSFGGGAAYDLSNKVYIDYTADDYTNAQKFGLCTVHTAGDRMFATTSETSVIWWKTTAKGTSNPDPINEDWTTGDFDGNADWTSL